MVLAVALWEQHPDLAVHANEPAWLDPCTAPYGPIRASAVQSGIFPIRYEHQGRDYVFSASRSRRCRQATSEAVLASAADGEIDLERFDELTGARLQIVVGSVLRPPRPLLG
jgi:hypothetical protein